MRARFGEGFRCSQCDKEFEPYDIVMAKPSRSRSRMKWYHLRCYESLLIE